jgi:hypothetical protein
MDVHIQRSVSGVFFAPVEVPADTQDLNRRILRTLDDARIPVVLPDSRESIVVPRLPY